MKIKNHNIGLAASEAAEKLAAEGMMLMPSAVTIAIVTASIVDGVDADSEAASDILAAAREIRRRRGRRWCFESDTLETPARRRRARLKTRRARRVLASVA